MTAERWLPVVGFESRYAVSSHGRVWSWFRGGRHLKLCENGSGYHSVALGHGNSRCVHRLVLKAFVGPPPAGYMGCHNDGVSTNNRVDNLRWDTRKSNAEDRVRHGGYPCGVQHRDAKLTEADVVDICRRLDLGESQRAIGKDYPVCHTTIGDIKTGKRWSRFTGRG